jgi:hypothetical protein
MRGETGMHLIIIFAAIGLACVGPFMSGTTNDDAAYVSEWRADPSETPSDEDSTESETQHSSLG